MPSLTRSGLRNEMDRRQFLKGVGVAGEVRDAHHLLTDDYRVASFGERDCTAAVLKPALAEKISSVELEMSGSVKP